MEGPPTAKSMPSLEDKAMNTTDEKKREEENRRLRRMLAEMGIPCEERPRGESLEEENRRLEADVRWYQTVLEDV